MKLSEMKVYSLRSKDEMDKQKGGYLSREAVLKALQEERAYLIARGQYGAENVLVKHAINVIEELPVERR